MSALDWYKIRDTLLGHNQTVQNVSLAIDMASKSQHPVALWLTQVMAGQLVVTREDASRVFLERQNDPRSVALGVLVIASSNQSLLKKAADDGDALAQAFMFSLPNGLEYAQKASLQNERDGFFRLAAHFDFRVGDVERAKQNYRRASLLGHVVAMNKYASFLSEEDPDRVMWLSKAALAGVRDDFLASFSEFVRRFKLGRLPPSVMFDIGNALKG
jgi:TPR repeat protein